LKRKYIKNWIHIPDGGSGRETLLDETRRIKQKCEEIKIIKKSIKLVTDDFSEDFYFFIL